MKRPTPRQAPGGGFRYGTRPGAVGVLCLLLAGLSGCGDAFALCTDGTTGSVTVVSGSGPTADSLAASACALAGPP